ncbi:MAG: PEP-CTERM sorting domain-containing protein [Halodesulfovibrio sp.]
MKNFISLLIFLLTIVITGLMPASRAHAFFIEYTETYTDDSSQPFGEFPWLSANFVDYAPGEVLLTLRAVNLSDAEFATSWFFNFNPLKDVSQLDIRYLEGTAAASVTVDPDLISAGANVTMPISIDFATSASSFKAKKTTLDRFEAGDYTVFLLSGLNDLTAEDFNTIFSNKGLDYLSVVHIQGIGQGSAWVKDGTPVPAPEPQTWILMGAGLVLLAIGSRKVRKNQAAA